MFNTLGECWALYKLKNFDYDFLTTEKKFEILSNITRFLVNVGEEAKILIVPVVVDYKDHFEKLRNELERDAMYEMVEDYLRGTSDYIIKGHEGNVNDYSVFIMINFNTRGDMIENLKDFISAFITEPMSTINTFLGLDLKEISKRKLKNFKRFSNEYKSRQSRRLNIEEASSYDTQWLIKRMFYRGLDEEVEMRKNWEPFFHNEKNKNGDDVIVPYTKDILTITSGVVDYNEKRSLKIDHDKNLTSYQTFITLSRIPDSMEFPGCEFLIFSQLMSFPVETCIYISNIDHKKAIRNLDKKRKEVKAQIDHIERNREDIPDELLEAREHADELEYELKNSNSPLTKASITFCVSAENKEKLEDRVKCLMDFYKDTNFGVERPRTDQEKLFMEFIPGSKRYIKDFILPLPPRTLAGGMFGTTCELGDNVGLYIGRGGSLQKPIFLDLLHACQLNKPAAAFIEGAQGFGKTFNSNLLVYLHVLNGARAFIIDPKGDRKDWDYKLPELSGYINTVEFKSSKEDMGKLDPFIIHKEDMNEAGQLALNIITELFEIKSGSKASIALKESIEKVKNIRVPCMKSLAQCLDSFPDGDKCQEEAELLARQIRNLNRPDLTGLLYSDGSQKGLNFNNRINIVMIQDLKLPVSSNLSKKDYTSEEKLGTVLMLAIANFAKKFSQMDNSIRKIIVMDEAWALSKTQQGEDLFERLARTGRSLNTSCIFIGHSSKDLTTEGIRNAIRYKFIFNVGNRDEAINTLDFLGVDITEENIALLSSDERGLANGECLFSDVEGRIGLLKFDAVYDHLVNAFRTTPPKRKGAIEFG
ncbi:MAG: ATP-binding protein [Clostridiales bacterium]